MTQTTTDTRVAIIEAALTCFQTQGLRKTTVVDIVRTAGLSRTTIYEYFKDKAAIVEAAAEHASQLFYREMALAMDRGHTLEDRLSLAAVVVIRGRQLIEPEKYFDADEVSLLLTQNAATLLSECSDFLTPYIIAAKLTGEVHKDLDVAYAAEWFARILFSLFSTPSSRLDFDDAEVIRSFVRANVHGFTGPADQPRRPAKGDDRRRREGRQS